MGLFWPSTNDYCFYDDGIPIFFSIDPQYIIFLSSFGLLLHNQVCYDLPFKDGDSYHFITGGDVDALSYLKIILRQQDLEYCLFSTWCMASEDIHQIGDWLKDGKIKKLDAYRKKLGSPYPKNL